MIGKFRIIKNDTFDVARRLREIDFGYFVAYNYKLKRFELHNRKQVGSTFCLVLPFASLDCRAIEYVRQTRSERSDKLFLEMERENQRLVKEQESRAKKENEYALEAVFRQL